MGKDQDKDDWDFSLGRWGADDLAGELNLWEMLGVQVRPFTVEDIIGVVTKHLEALVPILVRDGFLVQKGDKFILTEALKRLANRALVRGRDGYGEDED